MSEERIRQWATPKGPGVPGFSGFMGGADGCDHIYATCPILKRRHKRWGGEPGPLTDLLYPEDDSYGDICGWCKNLWRRRVAQEGE